jgi:hypothetical protein|nr:hypothetical protein [uncultured Campylobacter sp.]
MLTDELKKRNDAARRTLASLLNQDRSINAKIREAKSEAEKAQKKLENLQKTKEEINAKLQLLCDATSQLENTKPEEPKTTPPEAENSAQYGSYTA